MSPNKHEEVVKIGDALCFITGVPDKCQHVYEENVYILGNGDILVEKDYLCPTNEATQEYMMKEIDKRNTFLETGTARCLKCKKIYTPDFNTL